MVAALLKFESSELHAFKQGMEAKMHGVYVAKLTHIPHYRYAVADKDLDHLAALGAFEQVGAGLWQITDLGVRMYSAAVGGAK